MLDHLHEFARLLRKNGVRVSTAEVIDAAAAARTVGWHSGPQLSAALAATLVKNASDRPVFDELFQLFFHRHAELTGGASNPELAPLADAAGLTGQMRTDLLQAGLQAAMALGPMVRAGLGLATPEMSALVGAAEVDIQLTDIRSPLQVGFYSYRMAEALGLGQAEGQALAWARTAAGEMQLAPARAEALADAVRAGFTDLRRRLRAHVARVFARENRDFTRQLTLDALADKPLAQLSAKEVAELRREVTRLAELMRARLSRRVAHKRRGRLDLRRTLRRSMVTGGIPFELVHRYRRPQKPRLLVLCDISDSVRAVSRFMLQLVYTLQELFDRVQTFAFVAELGELTDLFRQHELERAIELTYAGAAVSTFANSNYGHSLHQFARRHMDRVTSRTTVIIIGDGRNNYHESQAHVLGEIRRRARQVLWLNPEPPAMWSLGDSAMDEYRPHCDRVLVVRDLDGLRRVLDHLIP